MTAGRKPSDRIASTSPASNPRLRLSPMRSLHHKVVMKTATPLATPAATARATARAMARATARATNGA